MKGSVLSRVLVGLLLCLTAAVAMAQTAEKTETLTGTVVAVDGDTLIVKMDSGEIRTFTPPAAGVFVIDGKNLKLSELQPGTKLTATYKTTTTTTTIPVVDTLEGTVVYAAGPTVILRLPSNERKQYNIKSTDPVKFYDHDGKEITVFDLRKNMNIKAMKITEAPHVEFAANTTVTGTAPAKMAAAAPAAAATGSKAAAPPSQQAAAETSAGEKPSKLPPTGTQLPLLGLIGLVSLATGLGLAVRRRGV